MENQQEINIPSQNTQSEGEVNNKEADIPNKKEQKLKQYKEKQQQKQQARQEKQKKKEVDQQNKEKEKQQEQNKKKDNSISIVDQDNSNKSDAPLDSDSMEDLQNKTLRENEERKKQSQIKKQERQEASKIRNKQNKQKRLDAKIERQSLSKAAKEEKQKQKEAKGGETASDNKTSSPNDKSISFEKLDGNQAHGKTIIKKEGKTIELNLKNNKPDGDVTITTNNSKILVQKNPTPLESQVIINQYDKSHKLTRVTEVFRFVNNQAEGPIVIRDLENQKETHCHAVKGEITGHVQQANEKGNITCNIENGKKQGEATMVQHRNQQTTKATFKDDKFIGKVIMQTKNTTQTFKTSKEGKLIKPMFYFLTLPWLLIQTIFHMMKRFIKHIAKGIFYLITFPYQIYKQIKKVKKYVVSRFN